MPQVISLVEMAFLPYPDPVPTPQTFPGMLKHQMDLSRKPVLKAPRV